MKYVCLTFDDGMKSHKYQVMPILNSYNMLGTFFISGEYCDLKQSCYLDWEELIPFNQSGHELGSHFYFHCDHSVKDEKFNVQSINLLESRMTSQKIPNPTTICYPGFHYNDGLKNITKQKEYTFARSGCEKSSDFKQFQAGGSGTVFDPITDDPLNVQCLGVFGNNYGFKHFKNDLNKIQHGKVGVFCFHDIYTKEKLRPVKKK